MNRSFREILDAAARPHVPDDVDLFPRIAARLERKSFMQTLRARPALLILVILIALSLLSGVAYAISRSLGYIPGVGIVEQGVPIRVLAEPVSVERDGITLTVSEAVLTGDKTVLLYSIENVPWSALSHQEDVPGCFDMPFLRLPNGSLLASGEGGGNMNQMRLTYPPIPADINEATFTLACISGTLPGLAPENWSLPLRFVPAPPDLTVVPVVEIVPTLAETALPAEQTPFSITQAMQVGEETVLLGAATHSEGSWIELRSMPRLTDANGQEVYATFPTLEGLPYYDWGLQFSSAGAYPFTVTFEGVEVSPQAGATAEFEFDAGDAPQPGQTWTPNLPIEIGGRTITLVNVYTDGQTQYTFDFTADPDVVGVSVQIPGTIPNGGGGGGGNPGAITAGLSYDNLPTGKLRIILSDLLIASSPKTWTLLWSPENALQAAPLYGVSLILDQFIPLDDGYYLIGHTEWTDERITDASPAGWDMKAYDASGQEVPLEPAMSEADMPMIQNLAPNQWAYHLHGTTFNGPITLRATQMGVNFANPVRFTLDLRSYGYEFSDDRLDMTWKTGLIPLDVPGMIANAFTATYVKEGDLRGFKIGIQADPSLQGLGFRIKSGLDTSGMDAVASGGGSYRDETTGLLFSTVTTDAKMNFPLTFAADGALVEGDWSTTWTPPASNADIGPATVAGACVTLEKWKQAAGSPEAIPPGLPGKVLVTRGALAPDPSLFITSLDGSNEQALAFGHGSLSPDESRLIYSDEQNRLMMFNLANGQKTGLGDGYLAPLWSPDGKKIAALRLTDKGYNIFVLDENGENPHALTDTTELLGLDGWNGNDQLLAQSGSKIDLLNVADGSRKTLLVTDYDSYGGPSAALSPDGRWLAYLGHVTGRMSPGIFVSRLNSSEKRLLVQLDHWMVSSPLFSPDGKWLAISVMNTDLPNGPITPALVNLETCQVVPLPGVNGTIVNWNSK